LRIGPDRRIRQCRFVSQADIEPDVRFAPESGH